MTKDNYLSIINFCKKNKKREIITKYFCLYSPFFVVAIYFLSILYLFINHDKRIFLFVFIPAADFVFVTVLRKILNKPRPYDVLSYTPLIKFEEGKGKSFPSRHTASAFIIAMGCLYLNTTFGVLILILASMIGLSRIICGVHYPKDVLLGIVISVIFGYVGFFIT